MKRFLRTSFFSGKKHLEHILSKLSPSTNPQRMSNGQIGRDHVAWGYRLFLDREPESDFVITEKLKAYPTTRDLRSAFLSSREFDLINPEYRFTESHIVIIELEDQARLFVDLSDKSVGMNVLQNKYEQSELKFIRELVKPGQTVLDIGANIGFFAITMASLVGLTGRVFAFEPIDKNADLLQRSILENKYESRIKIERVAVGHSSQKASIVMPTFSPNPVGAYLYADNAVLLQHDIKEVDMIALDHYPLSHPVHFIKMDIEGAEPLALKGAVELLKTDRPTILSEIHPEQLRRVSGMTSGQFLSWMQDKGYRCCTLEDGTLGARIHKIDDDQIRSVIFLP
jgi:FkbM family methyltransferase